MSNETLLAAIERHESQAASGSAVSEDRALALDYYLGEPLGNEVDGRSQVISRDVYDTVEWIKPQIADIFCAGDEVVMFTPSSREDVAAAEQETQYVNWVVTEKNDWFTTWSGWAHDALLQKVGYVKIHWDEREDKAKERYEDLTVEELQLLLSDQSVELVEAEADADDYGVPKYDATVQRTTEYGCVKIQNVAPESIYVDSNARGLNLQDPAVAFVEHRERKTLSQLREEGFKVDDDLTDAGESTGDWEDGLRDPLNPLRNTDEESTPASRRVWVREVWIRYDEDDDGIAELRHVIVVGTTILVNEEADQVPIAAMCPVMLPHQHVGLSVADAVMDLQRIKTALLRGSLDQQYLANNGRFAVDSNSVNLDDMLLSRPGGVVRVDGMPGQAIIPLTQPGSNAESIGLMEYIDRIGQKRTGINEQSQGLDPNVLQTATHSAQIATAAMQRIKFIARTFAETGVKALFLLVHAMTLKHARKEEIIKLRGQWVPVDPRQWVKRYDMAISVGLGAGDKTQQIVFLQNVLQIQQVAIQAGLTSPDKIYNTLKRLTQAAGFKNPDEFWNDPATTKPAPPAPHPEVLKEQAKAQAQAQIEAGKAQTTMEVEKMRGALKMQELQASLQLQASNDMRDSDREQMRAQMDAELKRQQIELDQWKARLQAEMDKYKADLDSATKLQIAGISQDTTISSTIMGNEHAYRQEALSAFKGLAEKDAEIMADAKPVVEVDGIKLAMAEVSRQMADIARQQQALDNRASQPAKIIRGPDGKAHAVDVGGVIRQVVRGPDGKIAALH